MLISTTTRQTSNCLQIITYHVASFRINHFKILRVRQSRSFAYGKFGGTSKEYYGIFRSGLYQRDIVKPTGLKSDVNSMRFIDRSLRLQINISSCISTRDSIEHFITMEFRVVPSDLKKIYSNTFCLCSVTFFAW